VPHSWRHSSVELRVYGFLRNFVPSDLDDKYIGRFRWNLTETAAAALGSIVLRSRKLTLKLWCCNCFFISCVRSNVLDWHSSLHCLALGNNLQNAKLYKAPRALFVSRGIFVCNIFDGKFFKFLIRPYSFYTADLRSKVNTVKTAAKNFSCTETHGVTSHWLALLESAHR